MMRMTGAYAYTKACGIIGKSFVGKRITALKFLKTLSELERLVFSDTRSELRDGSLLPSDLGLRIEKRAIDQIFAIINSFEKPPEVLLHQIRAYEYIDFKNCLYYIINGKKERPKIHNIGRFRTINFNAFPDITAMLKGTEFEYICEKVKNIKPQSIELSRLEAQLDVHYYKVLSKSLRNIHRDDRNILSWMIHEEISLKNCIWALRMRTYYNISTEEISGYLTNKTEAVSSLELPLDYRAPWSGWKWEKFLNPETPGKNWRLDPRYFQNVAANYLYKKAMRYFHLMPMTVTSVFCFIKIKQYEEDLLVSIVEGLSMGMECADIFNLLEMPV
jgi:vacuolar-type H+-ATPase subunit C/Vma6